MYGIIIIIIIIIISLQSYVLNSNATFAITLNVKTKKCLTLVVTFKLIMGKVRQTQLVYCC